MPKLTPTDDTGLNTSDAMMDSTMGRGEVPMTPSPSAFGSSPAGSPMGSAAVPMDTRGGQPMPAATQSSPLDPNAADTGGERMA